MEQSTPIGLGAAFALILITILMGEGPGIFVNIPSLVMVVGGTAASLFINFTMKEVLGAGDIFKDFFAHQQANLTEFVADFANLSRLARREGLLALDRELGNCPDDFMRYGLEMAVDGVDEAEIEQIMDIKIAEEGRKKKFSAKFSDTAGEMAPAFGMIGTLVGLVQMLANMADPASIGPAMAVALLTTLYGSILANVIFLPFGTKMKAQAAEIKQSRMLIKAGVMSIVRGESPSMVEKKLKLYLPEDAQASEEGDEAEAA